MRVAELAADAVENTWGTTWARGTSCEVICEYNLRRHTGLSLVYVALHFYSAHKSDVAGTRLVAGA